MSALSESESNETGALRAEIAQRIGTDRLPLAHAHDRKIFGGYGQDQACVCCDNPIRESEVLYEVELTDRQPPLILSMHRLCFVLWMEESEPR